jgi:predicted enzyme related to lactoylglutathione lyase
VIFLSGIRIQALLLAAFIAGCAAVTGNLPPITDAPTGSRYDGRVVWHDLLTNTPAESRKFYGELFGWEFEKPGIDIGFGDESSYMLIRHKGNLIGGMVDVNALDRDENISQWVTVMSVSDINATIERVGADGGEVLTQPTELGSRGTLAVVAGPDRAIFAMLQTRDGDPAERQPAHNEWLWDELWTNDVDRATAFYQQLVGFQHDDHAIENTDGSYRVLKADDKPRAGILANPFEGERPVWVNYLRVEDPKAITARVESLGGRIIVEAQARAIGGEVAFIAGPSGAGIALQTWPLK